MKLEELYNFYYRKLKKFAANILADQDTAHDAVVDVLLACSESTKINNFNDRQISSYLYSATRNKCIDKYRNKKIYYQYCNDLLDLSYWETFELDDEILLDDFIVKLPPSYQQILKLDLEGHTNEEICIRLNQSANTIYAKRSRAISELRKIINEKHNYRGGKLL